MNKIILPDEDKKETDNVIPFKRDLTPKPDIIPPDDDDWLWRLQQGCVFLCAAKPERDQYNRPMYNPILQEYHVFEKQWDEKRDKRSVKLLSNLNAEQWLWTDSKIWSKLFDLHKVIWTPEIN